jgi:hypothetical protein
VRTYGEVIDVRTTDVCSTDVRTTGVPGDTPPGAPAQFVWRGRLYLVREVLAQWVELGAWWALPRRAAVPSGAYAVPSFGDEPVRSVAADVGAVEREVWRVEATAGRAATPGVYDLVRDVPAPDPRVLDPLPSRWRLARALD